MDNNNVPSEWERVRRLKSDEWSWLTLNRISRGLSKLLGCVYPVGGEMLFSRSVRYLMWRRITTTVAMKVGRFVARSHLISTTGRLSRIGDKGILMSASLRFGFSSDFQSRRGGGSGSKGFHWESPTRWTASK